MTQSCQDTSSRVKKGEGITLPIALTKPPTMCSEHRIIENAIMVQDSSFGKAGGAGGVLNLGGILWLDRGLPNSSLLLTDLHATRHDFTEERRSPAILLSQVSGRDTQQADIAQQR